MLENILCSTDCAVCQMCCKFEPDELIDAPTFSKDEMMKAIAKKDGLVFIKKGNVYQIVLEPWGEKYICPLLTRVGCILNNERPFDCKSWPFYVMKKGEKYIVTLTEDCPVVSKKPMEIISSCIDNAFLDQCKIIISKYPDMITDYNRNMTILYEFDDKI